MKYLKSYDSYNEIISHRTKGLINDWLHLPKYLIDKLFSNIIGHLPDLNNKYLVLSGKKESNFGPLYSIPNRIHDDIEKININELPKEINLGKLNKNVLLSDWNIYFFKEVKKGPISNHTIYDIYITKDELSKGDLIYSQKLKSNDISNIKNPDSLHILVCAKRTELHDELRKQNDIEYKKQEMEYELDDFKKNLKSKRKNS